MPQAEAPSPLDHAVLRAALLDGARLWCRATGSALLADDLVDQQMGAIRRALRRAAPAKLDSPDGPAAPRYWWQND